MFCPKCGNQPASDRMRFCPSCGFRLDGVLDLLARDGVPTNPLPPLEKKRLSHKRRGIRRGGKIVFFSIVLLPLFIGLASLMDEGAPLVIPAIMFLVGISWMLYYRLFGDDEMPLQESPPIMIPVVQPVYLPPPHGMPVTSRSPLDPPQPQSVAEHTTRSLRQQ